MKNYLVIVVMVLGLSSCVTTSNNSFDVEKNLQEMMKEEQRYDDVFFQVYRGDLRQWVGKSITEVEDKFLRGGNKSMDVYDNGWESYSPFNSLYSERLTFYFQGGKVYNVLKE